MMECRPETRIAPPRPNRLGRSPLTWSALVLLSLVSATAAEDAPAVADAVLTVPEGFTAELYADDDLAHDVFSMTVDARGRVVVSGPGYVRILIDGDKDGRAEEAIPFASIEGGAQGMFFHGPDLLAIADGGLLRFRDADGDDRADGEPTRYLRFKTGGEHDTHAIRRGPDGWWYLIAGNGAGITRKYITDPNSPVREPQQGAILRFSPDLMSGEVVAHGYRNAYDFDFAAGGDLFTFDSDGERDITLPWYVPTRVFHALPGTHAGWVSRSWKRPGYYPDGPPVAAEFGRGSPTGVITYRHTQFPESYRNSLFALDWTFGRVFAVNLTRDGSGYTSTSELFAAAKGSVGFAPTDAVVGPDGSLFISVGGRGTRGGVYRIRYTGENPGTSPFDDGDNITRCLNAPQPLSSWSRAVWHPLAKKLGREAFSLAARNAKFSAAQRVRAIEILADRFGGLSENELNDLQVAESPEVRARAIWAHGRARRGPLSFEHLMRALEDGAPLVNRSGLEAWIDSEVEDFPDEKLPVLAKLLGADDPLVRQSAIRLVARLPDSVADKLPLICQRTSAQSILGIATARVRPPSPTLLDRYALAVGSVALKKSFPQESKLDAVRLLQLALGDMGPRQGSPSVFDGYQSTIDLSPHERSLDSLRVLIGEIFPTGDDVLDRELARVAAMVDPSNRDLLSALLDKITPDSEPTEDIHYLIATARLPIDRTKGQRAQIAEALVRLDQKIVENDLNRDRNFEDRLREMYLAHVDQDSRLPIAIVEQEGFGRSSHVLFLSRMPEETKAAAIQSFVTQIESDDDYEWTSDVVFIVGENADHFPLLRERYDDYALRPAIIIALSAKPGPEDRERFLDGLKTGQREVISASAKALHELALSTSPDEWGSLLALTMKMQRDRAEDPLVGRLVDLLDRWIGSRSQIRLPEAEASLYGPLLQSWREWMEQNYPDALNAGEGQQSSDLATLADLMAETDWASGNAERGEAVFEKRACAKCHNGARALGPRLTGVAKRFSRPDLFRSIVAPDLDISDRYQTLTVVTTGGEVHSGLVVYRSADGVTLRNASQQTIRLERSDIEEQRFTRKSLMPSGLLKDATPQELADLDAYLRTLR